MNNLEIQLQNLRNQSSDKITFHVIKDMSNDIMMYDKKNCIDKEKQLLQAESTQYPYTWTGIHPKINCRQRTVCKADLDTLSQGKVFHVGFDVIQG